MESAVLRRRRVFWAWVLAGFEVEEIGLVGGGLGGHLGTRRDLHLESDFTRFSLFVDLFLV